MSRLGPLLAATDFSAPARLAVERAARLAHEAEAPLTLLHVLPGEPLAQLRNWLGADSAPERQMAQQAQAELQGLAAEVAAASRAEVDARCAGGVAIDEILRAADALDAALIVTGARGSGFLRRLVLGTTAERLMRRSARPLLVVRQPPREAYRRALVALDFSPWSARALALARRVAPQARLVLLSAYQVPFEEKLHFAGVDAPTIDLYRGHARAEATQRLHALAAEAGLAPSQWEPRIVEGDASLRIVESEQALACDLTVLGKHGLSAGVELLLGSVTRHVLAEGGADVLVSTARG
ncbi:universal stress protein [Piscinibacter sp.]|uniref:universal stress protein n=1 Tax=Piscinibacter sp. TaxID=1903157 RepID=UPI0039E58D01